MQRSVSDDNRFAWRRTQTPRTEAPFVGLLDGDVLPHPPAGPGPGGAWGTRVPGGANGPHDHLPWRSDTVRRRRVETSGADLWSDNNWPNWRHLLRVITHTKGDITTWWVEEMDPQRIPFARTGIRQSVEIVNVLTKEYWCTQIVDDYPRIRTRGLVNPRRVTSGFPTAARRVLGAPDPALGSR